MRSIQILMIHDVIVMARCSNKKAPFGIRFIEMDHNVWAGTWAFPVKESYGREEKYENNRIDGAIYLSDEYPGCPHCKYKSIVLCDACKHVACYDGEMKSVVCPDCNNQGQLGGNVTHLDASAGR